LWGIRNATSLAPQLDTVRSEVIHNDMNPGNVLVDMVFSRLVNDAAAGAA
jgi:Ser/Thr protein kinase RdoA (MazF antagonist)